MGPMQMQVDPNQLKRAREMAKDRLELLDRRRDALVNLVFAGRAKATTFEPTVPDHDLWLAQSNYYQTLCDEAALEHEGLVLQVTELEKMIASIQNPSGILIPHLAHHPKPRGTA
jgi:hypothetical protein